MMTHAELNADQKASLTSWFDMADKALDEMGKLIDLNLAVCRDTMEDMAHCCQTACDVRDLPSAFNWQTEALKPFAERSVEYGARLFGWGSGSGLQWGRSVESQWGSLGHRVSAWMDSPLRPAQQGSDVFDLRKAMQAFDGVWDAMRQNLLQAQELASSKANVHKQPPKAVRKAGH